MVVIIIVLISIIFINKDHFMLLQNGNIQKNQAKLNNNVTLNTNNNISVDRICSTVNGKTICLDESILQIMNKMPALRQSSICIGQDNCINKNNIEILTGEKPIIINTGDKKALTNTSLKQVFTSIDYGGSGFFIFKMVLNDELYLTCNDNGNFYVALEQNGWNGQNFEAIFLNSSGGITVNVGLNSGDNSRPSGYCGKDAAIGTGLSSISNELGWSPLNGKCKVRVALKIKGKYVNVNGDGSLGFADNYNSVSAQFWIISLKSSIGIQSVSNGLAFRVDGGGFAGVVCDTPVVSDSVNSEICMGKCDCFWGHNCECCTYLTKYNNWYDINNGMAWFYMIEKTGVVDLGKIWTPQSVDNNSSQKLYIKNSRPLPSPQFKTPPKSSIVNNNIVMEYESTYINTSIDESRKSTYDTEPGLINL